MTGPPSLPGTVSKRSWTSLKGTMLIERPENSGHSYRWVQRSLPGTGAVLLGAHHTWAGASGTRRSSVDTKVPGYWLTGNLGRGWCLGTYSAPVPSHRLGHQVLDLERGSHDTCAPGSSMVAFTIASSPSLALFLFLFQGMNV